MPEKCPENCPLVPRVEALEESNKQHSRTHEGMYDRIRALETENAVQNAHWTNVNGKLDSLTEMVQKLTDKINEVENKPGKRWDSTVDKIILVVVGAVVGYMMMRLGLST